MVNMSSNINPGSAGNIGPSKLPGKNPAAQKPGFADAAKKAGQYLNEVDSQQQSADMSVKEMLAVKNQDVNSVVAEVAKADMSFKLLVGVRNKLIEAYKQTMNMQI
mgnify:FL=1